MSGQPLKRTICKIEGCSEPRVRGAVVCVKHLGEKRRCKGVNREGQRCKKSAMRGLDVCNRHGGSATALTTASRRTPALLELVAAYEGQLDPISAFENEFRRTYGRIVWIEDQIAHLESVDDLIWGKTKEEQTTVGEFPGTTTTYEARLHVFEEMLRWERKHFLELEKVWLRANLEERKLSMMQSQIDWTYSLVMSAARALGHDPSDPAVRDTIGRLFENERRKELE